MDNFYNKYVALCAKVNKAPSAVAEEIGLSRTAPHGWKRGRVPKDTTIVKLANYLNVPVSYFSEELASKIASAPTDSNENITVDNFKVSTVNALDLLPHDEKTFLAYYRKMSPEEQKMATAMLSGIVNAKEK